MSEKEKFGMEAVDGEASQEKYDEIGRELGDELNRDSRELLREGELAGAVLPSLEELMKRNPQVVGSMKVSELTDFLRSKIREHSDLIHPESDSEDEEDGQIHSELSE